MDQLKQMTKWPGGKKDELDVIKRFVPNFDGRYIDPFVGGGAVFLDMPSTTTCFINDKSEELINLYKSIKYQYPEFFASLCNIRNEFASIDVFMNTNPDEILDLFNKKTTVESYINKNILFFHHY